MKMITTFSIDPTICQMFKRKYPQKASDIIENFMRQDLDIVLDQESEASIQVEIEKQDKALAEQQLLVKRLKDQRARFIESKLIEAERKAKEQIVIEKQENEDIESIKEYGLAVDWQIAKRNNPKLTPKEFLASKCGGAQ